MAPLDRPVYVTTWALSKGIYVFAEGSFRGEYFVQGNYFIPEKEWTQDVDEAIRRFHALRVKAIASAKKKIAKLENAEPKFKDIT